MANPVWVLSVNLETKSAAFVSGMGDAAKAARGAFTDIRSGANQAGREVGTSMFAARHALMATSEMFGGTLPRAITAFIADIGPVGAALEAAFPFAAIALGAFLLIEHLTKLQEEGQKLTQDQVKLGTAINNAFGMLDQKILQAQIRSDELRNNHLGALQKQLELIDKQSMNELVHSFEEVAKAADTVFGELKASWYQFGIGSAGAKHALDEFQTQYSSLLAQGKDKQASDLLGGTLKSAQRVLELQKEAKANSGTLTSAPGEGADIGASMRAQIELKKSGVGFTEKEIAAQEALVQALDAQVKIEQRIADLKKIDSANATKSAGNEASARQSEAAKESAASMLRMGEQAIAGDRATAEAQLAVKRGSIQERLALDLDFAARERDLQLAANQAEISALDASGKDYANQLKALKDKALEITQQYATKSQEVTAKATTEQAALDLRNLETGEREKIDATREGSAARLAAVNAAIKEEESLGLQDTQYYRELLQQRIETTRTMLEEDNRTRSEMGKEAAEDFTRQGQQMIAADKSLMALYNSSHHTSEEQRVAQERLIADEEYTVKLIAFQKELAALDHSGKDYLSKLKALQDQEKQLTQQHENDITQIKEKAEEERNARILSAERQATSAIAGGLAQSIMGHQTWSAMVTKFAGEAAEGFIKNSFLILMQQDKQRLSDARTAATNAYEAGTSIGGPLAPVTGALFAAAAFAGAMAFESGGVVPGVGRGDIVPAMLTPGEGIVPGGVMEGLSDMAKNGGFKNNGGPSTVVHLHFRNNLSALDGAGMEKVLDRHADTIRKHVNNSLRKASR